MTPDIPGSKTASILSVLQKRLEQIDFSEVNQKEEIVIPRISLGEKLYITNMRIFFEGSFCFLFRGKEIQGDVSVYGSCPNGHEQMRRAFIDRILTEFTGILREEYPDIWRT